MQTGIYRQCSAGEAAMAQSPPGWRLWCDCLRTSPTSTMFETRARGGCGGDAVVRASSLVLHTSTSILCQDRTSGGPRGACRTADAPTCAAEASPENAPSTEAPWLVLVYCAGRPRTAPLAMTPGSGMQGLILRSKPMTKAGDGYNARDGHPSTAGRAQDRLDNGERKGLVATSRCAAAPRDGVSTLAAE